MIDKTALQIPFLTTCFLILSRTALIVNWMELIVFFLAFLHTFIDWAPFSRRSFLVSAIMAGNSVAGIEDW